MKKPVVLFIDDQEPMRRRMNATLKRFDYDVLTAADGNEGKELLTQRKIHVLLLDLALPGESGLDILRWTIAQLPHLPVIMYTGVGNIDVAVRAIKMGAYDFIEKSADTERLLLTLRNAIEKEHLESRLFEAQFGIIGQSQPVQDLLNDLRRIAPTEAKVLITGETGTGKELVANALHGLSRRRDKPFLRVTCTVLTESLRTSELFGYKKGAHDKADRDAPGRVKTADGGTIFLDEIGDMPLNVQSTLLTVLQTGEIEPVGGKAPEKVDVRVIAATNQDLRERIAEGAFREDLYYRLQEVVLEVPPLRKRPTDIGPLIEHFLKDAAYRNNYSSLALEPGVLELLEQYDWPGNVRELETLVSNLAIYSDGLLITKGEVARRLGKESLETDGGSTDYESAKKAFEREYYRNLLIKHEYNIAAVAREAGRHYTSVHPKLKFLGLIE
jgi:DNA-binding NtrC family response regulator